MTTGEFADLKPGERVFMAYWDGSDDTRDSVGEYVILRRGSRLVAVEVDAIEILEADDKSLAVHAHDVKCEAYYRTREEAYRSLVGEVREEVRRVTVVAEEFERLANESNGICGHEPPDQRKKCKRCESTANHDGSDGPLCCRHYIKADLDAGRRPCPADWHRGCMQTMEELCPQFLEADRHERR